MVLCAQEIFPFTSVFFHGGEVDCLEGEVALPGVHESVVESQV